MEVVVRTPLPPVKWNPVEVDEREVARIRAHTCRHVEYVEGCPHCWMALECVAAASIPNDLDQNLPMVPAP